MKFKEDIFFFHKSEISQNVITSKDKYLDKIQRKKNLELKNQQDSKEWIQVQAIWIEKAKKSAEKQTNLN